MKQEILKLEKNFFDLKFMNDKDWLDMTLHDNFKECGKSGKLFNKEGTIKYLLSRTSNREIDIYNFECNKINNKCYLIHYITISDSEKFYRTSIWVEEENLKMIYHQASKYEEDVKLIKY